MYICNVNIKQFMSDIFINSTPKPPKPYDNNCPPGHYISIQAGGNGHGVGDSCGCDGINPESNIDFIVPLLILSAFIIIKQKLKDFSEEDFINHWENIFR